MAAEEPIIKSFPDGHYLYIDLGLFATVGIPVGVQRWEMMGDRVYELIKLDDVVSPPRVEPSAPALHKLEQEPELIDGVMLDGFLFNTQQLAFVKEVEPSTVAKIEATIRSESGENRTRYIFEGVIYGLQRPYKKLLSILERDSLFSSAEPSLRQFIENCADAEKQAKLITLLDTLRNLYLMTDSANQQYANLRASFVTSCEQAATEMERDVINRAFHAAHCLFTNTMYDLEQPAKVSASAQAQAQAPAPPTLDETTRDKLLSSAEPGLCQFIENCQDEEKQANLIPLLESLRSLHTPDHFTTFDEVYQQYNERRNDFIAMLNRATDGQERDVINRALHASYCLCTNTLYDLAVV